MALLAATPPRCSSRCLPQKITIVNNLQRDITLYMTFNSSETGGYTLPDDFPGWTLVPPPVPNANPTLTTTMKANDGPLAVNFPCTQINSASHGAHFALSVDTVPGTGCIFGPPQTLAEFGLCDDWGPSYQTPIDTYDISLVAGSNYPVEITTDAPGVSIKAPGTTGNSNNPGVYGYGWTGCNSAPPPLACTPTDAEQHLPPPPDPRVPACSLSQQNGRNHTVYFGGPLP